MVSGKVAGLFYLWPLTFLAIVAVIVCIAFTKAEYDNGVLTHGGKRMIKVRLFLGISCAIYCLCIILANASTYWDQPTPGFRLYKHWHEFLVLFILGELSTLIATIYSFRVRGNRSWMIQTAAVLVVILSTFVTFLFLSPD
jgi:hypothetical protein